MIYITSCYIIKMSKGIRKKERMIKMDTQSIINAINQIQLHNDDQVIAYDKDNFIDLVKERL